MHLLEELVANGTNDHIRAVRDLQRKVQLDDPAQMMFTSGTRTR